MKTQKFDDLYNLKCNHLNVAKLEQYVYAFARKLTRKTYSGGSWDSTLVVNENGSFWFFELNDEKSWEITCENYLSTNVVGTRCFSMLSFLFALNYLMSEVHESENDSELLTEIIELYYAVRDNAENLLSKDESKIFFKVID